MKRAARCGQAGGAAVEFALVFPVFIAVVFGIVDYGWYYYQKFSLASAIREGVRHGAKFRDDTANGSQPNVEAEKEAKLRCDAGSVPSGSVAWVSGLYSIAPTRAVQLQGTFTFRPLVGMVRMPSPTMTYTMRMVLEQQY